MPAHGLGSRSSAARVPGQAARSSLLFLLAAQVLKSVVAGGNTHLHFKNLPRGCKQHERVDKWVLPPVLITSALCSRGSPGAVLLQPCMSYTQRLVWMLKYQRSPNTCSLHLGTNTSGYFLLGSALFFSHNFYLEICFVAFPQSFTHQVSVSQEFSELVRIKKSEGCLSFLSLSSKRL